MIERTLSVREKMRQALSESGREVRAQAQTQKRSSNMRGEAAEFPVAERAELVNGMGECFSCFIIVIIQREFTGIQFLSMSEQVLIIILLQLDDKRGIPFSFNMNACPVAEILEQAITAGISAAKGFRTTVLVKQIFCHAGSDRLRGILTAACMKHVRLKVFFRYSKQDEHVMRPFRAIWFADIRRYIHDSALPYLFLRQVLDVSLKSGIGKARCRVSKSNVRHNGRGNFPVIVLWNEQENFRVIENRRHGFTESIAAQQMGKPDSCTQCITQNLSFSFSRERPWKQSGCIADAVGVIFWRMNVQMELFGVFF